MSVPRILCALAPVLALVASLEPGSVYRYAYEGEVLVDERCELRDVAQRWSGEMRLARVWQRGRESLLRVQVSELELKSPKERRAGTEGAASYFLFRDGGCVRVLERPDEPPALRNLKRGVASVLQEPPPQHPSGRPLRQADVSGWCEVSYRANGSRVLRTKERCVHPGAPDNPDSAVASGLRSARVVHASESECEGAVERCTTRDLVRYSADLWTRPALCVRASSELKRLAKEEEEEAERIEAEDVESAIRKLRHASGGMLREAELLAAEAPAPADAPASLSASVRQSGDALSRVAEVKSASAFLRVLGALRAAPEEEVLRVLRDPRLRAPLLDAAAASGSEAASAAAFRALDFRTEGALAERFLVALAASPRPLPSHLDLVQSLLEEGGLEEGVRATLLATLGSLMAALRPRHPERVEASRRWLESRCSGVAWLRALRNAAHEGSAPLLLRRARDKEEECLEAMLALRAIPAHRLPPESASVMRRIVEEGRRDRSCRAVAAELLAGLRPGEPLAALARPGQDAEFVAFAAARLRHPELGGPHAALYASPGAASTDFRRPLVAGEEANVTYGMSLEMLEGGLLKRSSFEVRARSEEVLSVGLFAEGLSSLAGQEGQGEEEEATAGMELRVLGAALRPYTFFRGTSELLGHAWAGTASEMTPALQGHFALADDRRRRFLGCGAAVALRLDAALSADLSASVRVSIWNRNSQSTVRNAVSVVGRGAATVEAPPAESRVEFSFSGQTAVDFDTDFDFYESPFRMCLRMQRPDTQIRYETRRSVRVGRFERRRATRRRRRLPGHSYALFPANDAQCRRIVTH